jgi:hypothetical protein
MDRTPSGDDDLYLELEGTDAPTTELPASTKWHRAHGRSTREQSAAGRQLLTPPEEKSLVEYVLRMSRNGYPLQVKHLRRLASVLLSQRAESRDAVYAPAERTLPGKNWPQAFYKRHPELTSRRLKAIDWKRHEQNIYHKILEWFAIIGPQLQAPTVLKENVYNMDETGIMLSALGSLKVLVGRDDLRNYRGAGVQRTTVTAVECICADGQALFPLIIWPGVTQVSSWTSHETPGWRFACSESGYMNSRINLEWIQQVFDPLTRAKANGKPRVLINDGFGSHESLEVMTHCFEQNIILCRLPSHTSHKLQPCDVGVFGPLKTAYREQVEQQFRRGAGAVSKEHFTRLYSNARNKALTARNIHAGWSKAGLFPFYPDRVLRSMTQPVAPPSHVSPQVNEADQPCQTVPLRTPTSARSLETFQKQMEAGPGSSLVSHNALLEKAIKALGKSFADGALLREEIQGLLEQNSEKRSRNSLKRTVVGRGRIMSYEDIVEVRKQRVEKEAAKKGMQKPKGRRRRVDATRCEVASPLSKEFYAAEAEIRTMDLGNYCGVLRF